MAIRNIRTVEDPVLRKHCKVVKEVDDRIKVLIQDMLDTMYKAEGVGLAAPQVGIMKRVIVVDIGQGPVALVNPEMVESSGEQQGPEGCLSVPGEEGEVIRPDYVKVKGLNENGEAVEIEGKDFFARALCHEMDHLDGILYIDKIVK